MHKYAEWEVEDYLVYDEPLGKTVMQIVDAPYYNSKKEFKVKLKDVVDFGVHGDYSEDTLGEYDCKEFTLLCKAEIHNPTKFVSERSLLRNDSNGMLVHSTGKYLPQGQTEFLASFEARVLSNPKNISDIEVGHVGMLTMNADWYLIKEDYAATE